MRKLYLLLLLCIPLLVGAQTVSLTSAGVAYTQNFNTLASTGSSSSLPTGWFLVETGTGAAADGSYVADNGATNSGNAYSYGSTGNTERALGSLQSGTVIPGFGAGFTNNTGVTVNSLVIAFKGEMWRVGVTGRTTPDILHFQYSLDATAISNGTWSDVNELDVQSPKLNVTTGALDGNASGNNVALSYTIAGLSIPAGATFYIRYLDENITSSDDGLAIDDFSLTPTAGAVAACAAPATQPSAFVTGTTTTTSIDGSFTASIGGADGYLVLVSTSATLSQNPTNGTAYTAGDAIGNATVVSAGTATGFSASDLLASTTYYFFVFAYNNVGCTGGPAYLVTSPLSGSASTLAPPSCAAPTAAPTAIQLVLGSTTISGSFTAASGADGYMAVISTNNALSFTPANGTVYTVGTVVAANSTVIKYGAGTTFSATGLSASTTYYLYIFSVNQFNCVGGPLYFATPATANGTTTAGGTGVPTGYYDAAAGLSCAPLKTALSSIISSMSAKSYGSLWAQYQVSDIKPREVGTGSANVIWDIYSDNPTGTDPYNFTPGTNQCGNYSNESDCYNREHSVPQNWFDASASSGSIGPESDYHHIFPTDGKVNGYRSNFIYGEVTSPTTTSQNGSKLGPNAFAGLTGTAFEPIDAYKGDVARAFLYFVTRYQSSMTSFSGGSNGVQAFDATTFPSVDVPYLKLMLKWHNQDPVSQKEIDRNNAAYTYQGNRNPFVDHPEYVEMVWNSTCTGLGALPVNLLWFKGALKGELVNLIWETATEQNLLKYEIQRSVNGKDFENIGSVKATAQGKYSFADNIASLTGRRLYYRLKMVDVNGSSRLSEVFSLHVQLNARFQVYPNPASSSMNVDLGASAFTGVMTITDMTGRSLYTQRVTNHQGQLPVKVQQLPNGRYLIALKADNGALSAQPFNVVR